MKKLSHHHLLWEYWLLGITAAAILLAAMYLLMRMPERTKSYYNHYDMAHTEFPGKSAPLPDDNLVIKFSSTQGSYINHVPLTIHDMRGNQLVATVSEGPDFSTSLREGSYLLTAWFGGVMERYRVDIPGNAKPVMFILG